MRWLPRMDSSGSWKFIAGSGKPSCATNPKDYGKRYTRYQRGEFDALAMWVQEKECFVFWTLNELVERGSSLRLLVCGQRLQQLASVRRIGRTPLANVRS